MSDNLKKLREQHAKLVTEARGILDGGDLNSDKEQQFDALMADADKLSERIEREQKLTDAERRKAAEIAEVADRTDRSKHEIEDSEENYQRAFRDYLRHGMEGVGEDYRGLFMARKNQVDTRAQSVTGGSPVGLYGGYTVAEGFFNELESAMKAFGGMLNVARTITTSTGADLPMPTSDDTSNKGAILGENKPITEQDVMFSQTVLGAHKYTSKLIRVPYELLQDSAFNMESFIAERAGERLGRILNEHFTTGNGTTQPEGVVTGASLGVTGSGTSGITYNDLIDLEHSVDPAYRNNARFMFNDSTLKVLRKLKDSEGRPLWQPSLLQGVASTLNGRPYEVNQDMADIGLSAKSILFGDFSHYFVRRVRDFTLVRLNERYADNLQVGFFVYCRFDGKLKDAGQAPIKYLQHGAASP